MGKPPPIKNLKPCPFCGAKASAFRTDRTWAYPKWRVECRRCGCFRQSTQRCAAVRMWNKRSMERVPIVVPGSARLHFEVKGGADKWLE